MVWFQCEDCGDNLKKPKLLNHFRSCSATKLSCIDCGQTFGQESVQGHTQCITEAEKYGPKGQVNASNGKTPSSKKDSKPQPNFDINVGLSERPPWFCSICNTKATSKQTLLLHAEGKKHRAKAKAIHAASGQSKQMENSVTDVKLPAENTPKIEVTENKQEDEVDLPKVDAACKISNTEIVTLSSKKKRNLDASENDSSGKKPRDGTPTEEGNGEVIQEERTSAAESITKVKWKKLITSTLKSNPEGVMKMKKLQKLVLKALQESGITDDKTQLIDALEHKINSSSRFSVDKKYVRLVAKD